MTFEHFALNVTDPQAMAGWYVAQFGLSVLRRRADPPYTHFLADLRGRVFLELYCNPAAPIPQYAAVPPLSFHFGFATDDAAAARERLQLAGATLFQDEPQPDGSVLVMMRDPWGVPFQLCQRAKPF